MFLKSKETRQKAWVQKVPFLVRCSLGLQTEATIESLGGGRDSTLELVILFTFTILVLVALSVFFADYCMDPDKSTRAAAEKYFGDAGGGNMKLRAAGELSGAESRS